MTESAYRQTARTTTTRHGERGSYDRDAVHALLDEQLLCHLGYVVDGAPRVLPTLIVRVGETIYLHGSTGATPLLGARRSPDGLPVCVTVTAMDALVLARSQFNHSANYRSMVAHGTARLVTDAETKRAVLSALVEKVGAGRSAQSRPPTTAELAATAVLALDLDEVSLKRRAAGAMDEPEDLDLPYWAGVVPLRVTAGFGIPEAGVTAPAPDYVPTPGPWFAPVTLRGTHVVLEPMRREDGEALRVALDDEEVYRHLTYTRPTDEAKMRVITDLALAQRDAGTLIPFTIRDAATGEVVGTTSFHDLNPDRETLAIGRTQVARPRWRTAVNTEAKLLLMTHAFETLGVGRLEWHTDLRNERSQAAIARLGAVREGVLRRHKRRGDGTWRDTVLFAMTAEDWPVAKKTLVARLGRGSD